jgi:hypothetical protein
LGDRLFGDAIAMPAASVRVPNSRRDISLIAMAIVLRIFFFVGKKLQLPKL